MNFLEGERKTFIWGNSGSGISEFSWQLAQEYKAAWVGNDASAHITLLRDTVAEELAFRLEQLNVSPVEMRIRVEKTAQQWGLLPLLEQVPYELSTGQTRRLAIASALITNPQALVIDCPFDGLDTESCKTIFKFLQSFPNAVVVCDRRINPLTKEFDCYQLIDKSNLFFTSPNLSAEPQPDAHASQVEAGKHSEFETQSFDRPVPNTNINSTAELNRLVWKQWEIARSYPQQRKEPVPTTTQPTVTHPIKTQPAPIKPTPLQSETTLPIPAHLKTGLINLSTRRMLIDPKNNQEDSNKLPYTASLDSYARSADPTSDSLLSYTCLAEDFSPKQGNFQIKPVTFMLSPGDLVHLGGANGCGKTTLLLGICTIVPYSGSLARTSIGWSPTDIETTFSQRTVLNEISMGSTLEHAQAVLEWIGISRFGNMNPLDLPTSIRRLLSLGCALVRGAGIILLDEPTIGLDTDGYNQIFELLPKIAYGQWHEFLLTQGLSPLHSTAPTVLWSSHDTHLAKLANKHIHLG